MYVTPRPNAPAASAPRWRTTGAAVAPKIISLARECLHGLFLSPSDAKGPRKRGQTCYALPPSKYLRANLVCALRMAATTRARCAAARQRPAVHLADSCPVKQSGTCYTRTEKKIGPRQRSCGGQETHVVIHVGTCRYICRRARKRDGRPLLHLACAGTPCAAAKGCVWPGNKGIITTW